MLVGGVARELERGGLRDVVDDAQAQVLAEQGVRAVGEHAERGPDGREEHVERGHGALQGAGVHGELGPVLAPAPAADDEAEGVREQLDLGCGERLGGGAVCGERDAAALEDEREAVEVRAGDGGDEAGEAAGGEAGLVGVRLVVRLRGGGPLRGDERLHGEALQGDELVARVVCLEGVEDGLEAARGEEVQDGALERGAADVRAGEVAVEAAHDAHEALDVAAVDLRLGEVHEAGELAGGGAWGDVEARALGGGLVAGRAGAVLERGLALRGVDGVPV